MSRDEVDRTLGHLQGERERISSALLEFESHQGYRLLEGAALSGETARRQAEVRSRLSALWELFDLYGSTLGAAQDLRARYSRPGQAQLAELTRLLAGPSVELPAVEVPLERRTLLASPGGQRLTLQAVVARMTPLYEEAARLVASVDTVWTALLSRLEDLDRDRRAAAEAAGEPVPPELDRLGRDLDKLGATVRGDPLALSRDGRPDTEEFDRLGRELAALRQRFAEVAQVRAGFAERFQRLRDTVGLVREAEAEARHARDEVLAKIASPVLPELPATAASLDDRLAALRHLADQRRWADLTERLADVERAVTTALEQSRATTGLITGLLDRREELRGRLEAYRMKAGRLGHAEDTELAVLHQRARDLLWTSPCDLRAATVALSGYQQAISSRAKGSNG